MNIQVRVTRPLMYAGERREAGQVLRVDPLTAAEMLCSTRVELVDKDDIVSVRKAAEAEAQATVRRMSLGQRTH